MVFAHLPQRKMNISGYGTAKSYPSKSSKSSMEVSVSSWRGTPSKIIHFSGIFHETNHSALGVPPWKPQMMEPWQDHHLDRSDSCPSVEGPVAPSAHAPLPCGFMCGHVRTLQQRSRFIRDLYGIYMGLIWDLFWIYMGFTWDLHGIYMDFNGFIWEVYGFFGSVWNVINKSWDLTSKAWVWISRTWENTLIVQWTWGYK